MALNSGVCRKTSLLGLILVGSIALVPAAPSRGQDALDAAKHRQSVMDRLGDDIKAIKLYVAGQGGRDAAVAAAKDLETTAPLVPGLFPPGSDSKALPGKSAAKPEIWDNPDDFQQLAQALTTGAADLRKTVDAGDVATIRDSMRSLAKNACGACHENYRGRKDGD